MSKKNDRDERKLVAELLRRVADRMEQDDAFAAWLLGGEGGLTWAPKLAAPPKAAAVRPVQSIESEAAGPSEHEPDLLELYIQGGAEGLRAQLSRMELAHLHRLVVKHGWDPTRKVRKWKTHRNVVEHLVSAVVRQMSKGDVFDSTSS